MFNTSVFYLQRHEQYRELCISVWNRNVSVEPPTWQLHHRAVKWIQCWFHSRFLSRRVESGYFSRYPTVIRLMVKLSFLTPLRCIVTWNCCCWLLKFQKLKFQTLRIGITVFCSFQCKWDSLSETKMIMEELDEMEMLETVTVKDGPKRHKATLMHVGMFV